MRVHRNPDTTVRRHTLNPQGSNCWGLMREEVTIKTLLGPLASDGEKVGMTIYWLLGLIFHLGSAKKPENRAAQTANIVCR